MFSALVADLEQREAPTQHWLSVAARSTSFHAPRTRPRPRRPRCRPELRPAGVLRRPSAPLPVSKVQSPRLFAAACSPPKRSLTTLATLVQSGGPGLASYLAPPANFTFIAPSDRAFDKFLAAVGPLAPNSSLVADTLVRRDGRGVILTVFQAYHILQVGIAPGFLTTGDTIVKSSLASTNVTTQARTSPGAQWDADDLATRWEGAPCRSDRRFRRIAVSAERNVSHCRPGARDDRPRARTVVSEFGNLCRRLGAHVRPSSLLTRADGDSGYRTSPLRSLARSRGWQHSSQQSDSLRPR